MVCANEKEKMVPGLRLAQAAILGIAVTAIIYTFSEGISGNDFWWHIKVGEWVVQNGAVPQTDIFSWYGTTHQIPWTPHEWLADVILYLIHDAWGSAGIYLLSVFAALLMTALLWRGARRYVQKNILVGGLFFALFAVTTSLFFYGRPHLFSFFLLYWELRILYGFVEDPADKGIYMLPVISCIWSNIHGGSAALSYVLCAVFLIVGMLRIRIGRIEPTVMEKKSLFRLLAVTVCAIAAILVNPVGIDILLYPYKSFGDSLQMTFISEWRSPDAKQLGDLILFFAPVVLLLIGFFAEEKRIRLIDLAVMGLFVLLFLRSVRFIMLWYIAAVFCAFPYVPECKVKPMSRKSEKALIAVCLAVFSLLIGRSVHETWKTHRNEGLISVTMSDEAIAAVSAAGPERLFNDYNLGEALIYHEIPVFFDARADLYAYDNIMADGISLMFLEQANPEADVPYADVDALIGKYDFDNILILKSRALYAYLTSRPEQFVCVYEDEHLGCFQVIR